MDSSGSNDNIKQDLQEEQKTDSGKQNSGKNKKRKKNTQFLSNTATQNARKSFTGDLVISENMIRLNRRWNYSTRPRPNALAIKHPETGEILFPGKKKIEVKEKPEEEGEKLQKPADSIEPTPVVQVPVRDNRK